MNSHRAWIDLVLERANELRSAGVLSISFEGCAATFAALPVVVGKDDSKPIEQEPDIVDPFQDPASYPGGLVPGFRIEKFETGE